MFQEYFPISYFFNMGGLALTCSDFVNALKVVICFEKHLFLKLTTAIPKRGNRYMR